MSVAETLVPSVEGRERVKVGALLTASAAAAGAVSGFGLGVALDVVGVPASGFPVLAVGVGVALSADLVHLTTGRLRPLAVRKQVPSQWTRLLGTRVAAMLYGARLGIGPATILQTWLWWAGAVVAASLGVGTSVAWGAVFGVSRSGAMLAVSAVIGRSAGRRMSLLVRAERAVGAAVAVALIAGVGLLWASG